MKNFRVILCFYFLGLSAVCAEPGLEGNVAVVTLEQATKQVIGQNNTSRVLSAKTEEIDRRTVHVIKTLTRDGRIQQETIDAGTGALLDINDSKFEELPE